MKSNLKDQQGFPIANAIKERKKKKTSQGLDYIYSSPELGSTCSFLLRSIVVVVIGLRGGGGGGWGAAPPPP